jgi:ABC-type sugar transport system ATPase subunit
MGAIAIEHVSKVFDGEVVAVDDVSLEVGDGELMVLVGPSGCGKSTVLRMLAGLEEVSAGTIAIDGRVVNRVPPKDRDIAMVFQNYALYPHMSVYENLAFSLRRRRVARAEIQRLQHELGTTTMYVTHDQVEAMTMGDRVAVMRDGRLVQLDTPQALYDRPADLFVAGFIGSPAMNFVQARLETSNGSLVATFGSNTLELPARGLPSAVVDNRLRDVIIGLRPEHLDLAVNGSNGKALMHAPVTLAEPVGAQVIVHLDLETLPFTGEGGDFCACLDSRRACSRGETLTLAVDPATLLFFVPEPQSALR